METKRKEKMKEANWRTTRGGRNGDLRPTLGVLWAIKSCETEDEVSNFWVLLVSSKKSLRGEGELK